MLLITVERFWIVRNIIPGENLLFLWNCYTVWKKHCKTLSSIPSTATVSHDEVQTINKGTEVDVLCVLTHTWIVTFWCKTYFVVVFFCYAHLFCYLIINFFFINWINWKLSYICLFLWFCYICLINICSVIYMYINIYIYIYMYI